MHLLQPRGHRLQFEERAVGWQGAGQRHQLRVPRALMHGNTVNAWQGTTNGKRTAMRTVLNGVLTNRNAEAEGLLDHVDSGAQGAGCVNKPRPASPETDSSSESGDDLWLHRTSEAENEN